MSPVVPALIISKRLCSLLLKPWVSLERNPEHSNRLWSNNFFSTRSFFSKRFPAVRSQPLKTSNYAFAVGFVKISSSILCRQL